MNNSLEPLIQLWQDILRTQDCPMDMDFEDFVSAMTAFACYLEMPVNHFAAYMVHSKSNPDMSQHILSVDDEQVAFAKGPTIMWTGWYMAEVEPDIEQLMDEV